MTILVFGGSGATGRLLVEQLLGRGQNVKVIVRSPDNLPATIKNHQHLSIINASILDISDADMIQHVKGCEAVASCLGHNLSLRGIWGPPFRLVTDAIRRICEAIKANNSEMQTKIVLMNTAGNSNRDLKEPMSIAQKCVMSLLRVLLPPQADNEKAADYLRVLIGQNDRLINWAIVRPDTLINEIDVTEYEIHVSPIRSAVFNPGKTSRINVSHFMADLITDKDIWDKWKGQMPVIYNK